MKSNYLKMQNHNVYIPKLIQRPSSYSIKNRKLINYYHRNNNLSKSTITGFYTSKNINPNKSSLFTSSSSYNIFTTKPQTPKMKKILKLRPQSASCKLRYKKIFPKVGNDLNINMDSSNCLDTEKLYQEIYQMKKIVKKLEKELKEEANQNNAKEKELNKKENEINNIINKSKTLKSNNYYNELEKKDINDNNNTNTLILKIKREIKNTSNDIKKENNKLETLKKSLFVTKTQELNIESNLYNEYINKINSLINNALQTQQRNELQFKELDILERNIEKQNFIMDKMMKENMKLEYQEDFLNYKLDKLKKELRLKIEKSKKNKKEINILLLKNKNLKKDKTISKTILLAQNNEKNKNNVPISYKNLFINKISQLKKNINFYKRQLKITEDELNKLKNQKKNLIESKPIFFQKINIEKDLIDNQNKIKSYEMSKSSNTNPKNEDLINKLKENYKKIKEEELTLEKKANIYYEALKDIIIKNENNDNNINNNQIEFGIDETNPYFTENEENLPELNHKFTSQQYNQYTYILFKNFEAKKIIKEKAQEKVINKFNEFIIKNKINEITYPSSEFDNIIEEYTKIILSTLNSENNYNHNMTKIFIGALLYNSECNVNKLIDYFSLLFNYTNDYSLDEKKFVQNLKTKYRKEMKKLIECINNSILNEHSENSEKEYFSLFKMKDLLDNNNIKFKDKYIEFLFYYMKKFEDQNAKLDDLKYNLLNEIIPISDTSIHSKILLSTEKIEEIKKNDSAMLNISDNDENNNKNNDNNNDINISKKNESENENESDINNKAKINDEDNNNDDSDYLGENSKEINIDDMPKESKEENKIKKPLSAKKYKEDDDDIINNKLANNNLEDESVTEITNEEFIKNIKESFNIINRALEKNSLKFIPYIKEYVNKKENNGKIYEYINIADLNDKLNEINIVLSDIQLSCLCSKYCLPDEIRLIDINYFNKSLIDFKNGNFKIDI